MHAVFGQQFAPEAVFGLQALGPAEVATGGGGGGGGGHTGTAARKHRWEADKKLWAPSEKPAKPATLKSQTVKLRDTAAARALLEKALVPKAATARPSASIITTIVEDTSELNEEFEALLAFALLD